jgi:hypothetical protein
VVPSISTQSTKLLEEPRSIPEGSFSDKFSVQSPEQVQTITWGKALSTKNKPGSWKNMDVTFWKPPNNIQKSTDPDSIANRIRLIRAQNETPNHILAISGPSSSSIDQSEQKKASHQMIFKRIESLATDVHLYHIPVPVNKKGIGNFKNGNGSNLFLC